MKDNDINNTTLKELSLEDLGENVEGIEVSIDRLLFFRASCNL
jgi:hypothetical protein